MKTLKPMWLWLPLCMLIVGFCFLIIIFMYAYWRNTTCFGCAAVNAVEDNSPMTQPGARRAISHRDGWTNAEGTPVRVSIASKQLEYGRNLFLLNASTDSLHMSFSIAGAVLVKLGHLADGHNPTVYGLCTGDLRIDETSVIEHIKGQESAMNYYFFIADIQAKNDEIKVANVVSQGPFQLESDGAFFVDLMTDDKILGIISSAGKTSVNTCSGERTFGSSFRPHLMPSVLMFLYDHTARCSTSIQKVGEGWIHISAARELESGLFEVRFSIDRDFVYNNGERSIYLEKDKQEQVTLRIPTEGGKD